MYVTDTGFSCHAVYGWDMLRYTYQGEIYWACIDDDRTHRWAGFNAIGGLMFVLEKCKVLEYSILVLVEDVINYKPKYEIVIDGNITSMMIRIKDNDVHVVAHMHRCVSLFVISFCCYECLDNCGCGCVKVDPDMSQSSISNQYRVWS